VLEGEEHTAERLRTGEVLAAVSADPVPVSGCRIRPLGALRYGATASPVFVRRHFTAGVDAGSLAAAPVLRFDRKDELQIRWARAAFGIELDAPTHWAPSATALLDASLAGLAWTLNPLMLVREHLGAGRLVEIVPEARSTCRSIGSMRTWARG
jgi:LysR family transcriptional regulator, chromosome initiation inhibitor